MEILIGDWDSDSNLWIKIKIFELGDEHLGLGSRLGYYDVTARLILLIDLFSYVYCCLLFVV